MQYVTSKMCTRSNENEMLYAASALALRSASTRRLSVSQRCTSSLSFNTRVSFTGCPDPAILRTKLAAVDVAVSAGASLALPGEHSALRGVSERFSQNRTASRASKPAYARSLQKSKNFATTRIRGEDEKPTWSKRHRLRAPGGSWCSTLQCARGRLSPFCRAAQQRRSRKDQTASSRGR